jgi:hypothetical protein
MSKKLQRYIEKQPQIPDGFQYKTCILVSDSKGYTLRNACLRNDFPLETWCISGATTETLVDLINSRIRKAVTRHYKIIIYLWAGTCDLTIKERKFLKLKYKNNRAVDHIDQYKRAIKIVNKYQNAEIKLIDCPLLSIRHWNKNKGHPKPETIKVDDFIITRQIQELNYKIWEINDQLNKTSVKISKYYFRGRKRKGGKTCKSVNLSINSKDGIHPGRLLSLVITKHTLLEESEIIQIRVEQDELSSLF